MLGCPQRTEQPPTDLPPALENSDSNAAPPSGSSASASSTSAHWPFWPTRMRLHPLTRLTRDEQSGEPLVECRIEFQDSEDQTSKAVGQLTLQIYPDSTTPLGSGALETWNQDLRDLELNRRQYDDVTRTYLFRLQTTQPLPAGCELRAIFLSTDGKRMSAAMRLRQ